MVTTLFYTLAGQRFISILLGIIFALIIRKIVKDRKCIICNLPLYEIENHIYKVNDQCFKYNPQFISCKQ